MNNLSKKKKAQIWISAILYVLVTALIMVIVLEALSPILDNMKDQSIFERTRDTFLSLNQYIKDVSVEGQGSQRVVPVEIQKGTLAVQNNELEWKMSTKADILEPRSMQDLGNLFLVSNGEVSSYESNGTFVLENSKVKFVFNEIGSPTNFTNITSSEIINQSSLKTPSGSVDITTPGEFSFLVNDETSPSTGNGFTRLPLAGSDLGFASVIAHINTTQYEYELTLTLESGADYLVVGVKGLS